MFYFKNQKDKDLHLSINTNNHNKKKTHTPDHVLSAGKDEIQQPILFSFCSLLNVFETPFCSLQQWRQSQPVICLIQQNRHG